MTFALLFFLYKHFPDMPSAEAPKAGAADQRGGIPAQYTLDRYKSLSEIAVKSTQDIFQTIVAQALIPVLTAVLGYIFAKSGKDSDG